MDQFRLTKYDPAGRDATGAYKRDDWTSIGDIGEPFDSVVLTEKAYRAVEDAYVETILAFVHDAHLDGLTVAALEADDDTLAALGFPLSEGDKIAAAPLEAVIRAALRQDLWCKLSGPGGFFVHFGYDLYAYVGTPAAAPTAEKQAVQSGLFLEPMPSPYHDD